VKKVIAAECERLTATASRRGKLFGNGVLRDTRSTRDDSLLWFA
jgi:hypothetical protein